MAEHSSSLGVSSSLPADLYFCPLAAIPRYNPPFAVRILILSDIHSNLEALDACLAAAPAHDLVVNLGDTVGYGGNPNEVIARAREHWEKFLSAAITTKPSAA